MRDYYYVDVARLRIYAEQAKVSEKRIKLPSFKLSLSLTNPSAGLEQSSIVMAASTHEMIEGLLSYATQNKMLVKGRPYDLKNIESSEFGLVLETMTAERIIFKCDHLKSVRGLQEIGVWVSPPIESPRQLKPNDSTPQGVFLYLLEGYWTDDKEYSRAASMYTALNRVLDELGVAGALKEVGRLVTDRDDFRSPHEILRSLGGSRQERRSITALYRVRAASDNQMVATGVGTVRTFDLFGYPVFVSSADSSL